MKKGLSSCGHSQRPPAHDLVSRLAAPEADDGAGARPISSVSRSPKASAARRRPGVWRCAAGGSLPPAACARASRTTPLPERMPVAALVEITGTRPPPECSCSGGDGGAMHSSSSCGAPQFLMPRTRASSWRPTRPDGSRRQGQHGSSMTPASSSGMQMSSNHPLSLMRSVSECSDSSCSTPVKKERSGFWRTTCGARSAK